MWFPHRLFFPGWGRRGRHASVPRSRPHIPAKIWSLPLMPLLKRTKNSGKVKTVKLLQSEKGLAAIHFNVVTLVTLLSFPSHALHGDRAFQRRRRSGNLPTLL